MFFPKEFMWETNTEKHRAERIQRETITQRHNNNEMLPV